MNAPPLILIQNRFLLQHSTLKPTLTTPPTPTGKKKYRPLSLQTSETEPTSSDSTAMEKDGARRVPEEDDKFFSRLLTREDFNNNNNSNGYSCRVYYTAFSGSVPFRWEAEPGKPKTPAAAGDGTLPPLNPPPSLQSTPSLRSCPYSSESPPINARLILQKMKNILHLGARLKRLPARTRGGAQRLHKAARNPSGGGSAQISQSCWGAVPSAGDYSHADCQISESSNSSDLSKSSSDSGSEFGERLVSIAISQSRNWPDSPVHPAMFLSYGGRHRRS